MKKKLILNLLSFLFCFFLILVCKTERLDTNSDAAFLSALFRLSEGIPSYITSSPPTETTITLKIATESSIS